MTFLPTTVSAELVDLGLGSIGAVDVSGYVEHRFVPNRRARQLVEARR